MAIKNNTSGKGLGMGLSGLFGTERYKFSNAQDISRANLMINEIEPNSHQPRKHFDDQSLSELSESIKLHGILQPIIVKRSDNKFTIVAGERRYRAAKMANLNSIPTIILGSNTTDQAAMEIAILENIQREDLTPIEEARGYQELISTYDYTHESLAKSIGKSRSHITNMLRILNLPESVIDKINHGQISTGHAKILLTTDNPEELASTIVEDGISIRDLMKIVEEMNHNKHHQDGSKTKPTKDKDLSNLMKKVEGIISNHIQQKVKISLDKKRGLIIKINCHSENTTNVLDIIAKSIK